MASLKADRCDWHKPFPRTFTQTVLQSGPCLLTRPRAHGLGHCLISSYLDVLCPLAFFTIKVSAHRLPVCQIQRLLPAGPHSPTLSLPMSPTKRTCPPPCSGTTPPGLSPSHCGLSPRLVLPCFTCSFYSDNECIHLGNFKQTLP